MMKSDALPVRLSDYKPPAYRIDTVNIDLQLDPAKTRDVLALSLSAALNAEIEETKVGVWRM